MSKNTVLLGFWLFLSVLFSACSTHPSSLDVSAIQTAAVETVLAIRAPHPPCGHLPQMRLGNVEFGEGSSPWSIDENKKFSASSLVLSLSRFRPAGLAGRNRGRLGGGHATPIQKHP